MPEVLLDKMKLHTASPAGEAKGAIIVIQEAFGVNDHIKGIADKAAEAGYFAVAPDLYHRFAEDGTAKIVPYDDIEGIFELMAAMGDDDVMSDIDVVLKYLEEQGFTSDATGIVGFCMGGRIAFMVSARRKIGAGVGYYGGGIVTDNINGSPPMFDEAPTLQSPWLGLFGDLDAMIPSEGVEQLRQRLSESATASEIVRYPDADHGFNCDERESYNQAAAEDAWGRMLNWFGTHLSGK